MLGLPYFGLLMLSILLECTLLMCFSVESLASGVDTDYTETGTMGVFFTGRTTVRSLNCPWRQLLTSVILTLLCFPPTGRVFCGCVCTHMWEDNLRGLPACFPGTGITSTYHMPGFLCGSSGWNSGPTVCVAGTFLTELSP